MKILHYALGFPPYRTGGLTKFCIDLMHQQLKENHEVSLLWPGRIFIFKNKTKIKYHGKNNGIGNYEIICPVPVSYDEGIIDIEKFMANGNENTYSQFFKELKPDVIHLHTFMGLHKNMLEAAKKQNIRMVFTAHDFFPICPKVTMFQKGNSCNCVESCKDCALCNLTALSMLKMYILQSKLYRIIKNLKIVESLRKRHRDLYLSETTLNKVFNKDICNTPEDYKKLRNHYNMLIKYMDIIHFNSTITKNIYTKYLYINKYKIIPVTHMDISDHRKRKVFGNHLCITYLGPYGKAKGFFLLKKALDELWKEQQNFCLNVFFKIKDKIPYIKMHDRYTYSGLEKIFDKTDILVVPSIWYETFGYTVLEALSYGVPVIISSNVGAKDIVPNGAGIEFISGNYKQLKEIIKSITPARLSEMNQSILNEADIITIKNINCKIINSCYI